MARFIKTYVELDKFHGKLHLDNTTSYLSEFFDLTGTTGKPKDKVGQSSIRFGNWQAKLNTCGYMEVNIQHKPIKGSDWFDIVSKVKPSVFFSLIEPLFTRVKRLEYADGWSFEGLSTNNVYMFGNQNKLEVFGFNPRRDLTTLESKIDIVDDITDTNFEFDCDYRYIN